MSLAELQKMLAEALVERDSVARAPAWVDRATRELTGSSRMSPAEQLDVYREQFWWRHIACVAEDYPTLAATMGTEAFEALVTEYLEARPPTDFLLRNLGAGLADFVAERRPQDRLLADLARVEWAFIDAFDAADAPLLDPAAVAAIPEEAWPGVRLVLQPSLQRLSLAYPVQEMRTTFLRERAVVRAQAAPTFMVVHRNPRDLRLYQETMDELAFAMLARLAAGEPLGQAADGLAAETGREQEVQSRIGEWFTRWAALGWISRVLV